MAKEPSQTPEEEYQFSPETHVDSNPFSASKSTFSPMNDSTQSNIMERINRKNILMAIGVVVVIFVIYKIIETIDAAKTRKAGVSQVVVQPVVVPQEVQTLSPAVPMPPQTVAVANVTSRLNTLETQNSATQANFQKLNDDVNNLQGSVSNLTTQLSSVTTAVQSISDQMAQAAAKAAAAKKVVAKRSIPKPIYFVRAMIPGRAWLQGANGETTTVIVGSDLPGYGVVAGIDPGQGTIVTSAGAIIGYSPNDR